MEKVYLTQETVSGLMRTKETSSNLLLVFAIIMMWTVILLPVGIILFVIHRKTYNNSQTVQQKQYYLREDLILNKYKANTTQPDDYFESFRYYFYFEKSESLQLNERYLTKYGNECMKIEDVYEHAKIGDTVYLLCAADGKIEYVFNSRFWEIDELDFLQKDDLFIPR